MPDSNDPFELFGLDPDEPDGPTEPSDSGATRPWNDDVSPVTPEASDVQVTDDGDEDDGFVDLRRGSVRGGGRRWGLAVLGLLGVLLVVVGAGAWWVKGQIDPGSPGEEVAVTIPAGSSTSDIATLLADKRVITNASVFQWYVRVKGGDPFQAGDYRGLRVNSSMGDVVDVLKAGPAPPESVTFLLREGLWVAEARAAILEAFPGMDPAALDAALANTHPAFQPEGSSNIEGFLFPATYEVAETDVGDPQRLVDQMVATFERIATEEGLGGAETTLQGVAGSRTITPYEALIVASLVESEAKVPADRPKIARVIYNRLAEGMTLGIDATVLYALQDRSDSLTNSDLRIDSPYNTRVNTGLPPTPINSPGQSSIDAALHPADGDWLYYVLTDEDGSHYFTNSYSDFQRAVKDAQDRGIF